MKTGDFVNNTESGEWKEYHENGNLKSIRFLDESGKYNGKAQLFDRDGKLHEEYDYRKGVIMAYRYYDKEGKLAKEYNKVKNTLDFEGFLPNGVKYVEGRFVKEGRDGIWKFFDSAEVLEEETSYSDGVQSGLDIEFFSNGDTSAYINYTDGSKNGLYISYYLGGQLATQGNYVDGLAQGPWINYHKDGTVISEEYYLNDVLHGKNYYYDISGKLKRVSRYDDGYLLGIIEYDTAENVLSVQNLEAGQGKMELHFPDGKSLSTRQYKNANLVDSLHFFDGMGRVTSRGFLFDGTRVGYWSWYHPKGNLSAEGNYFYGEKDGEWKYYHSNGELRRKVMKDKGVSKGYDSSFFESGAVYNHFTYIDGSLYGPGTYHEPGGEVYLVKDYYKGNVQGYSYMDNSGQMKPYIPIEKGTGDVKTTYSNGQEAMTAHYENGFYHGTLSVNYPNGQLWKTGEYVHGQRQGAWKEYYPNGSPKTEENYSDGDLEGEAQYFWENGKLKETATFLHDKRHGKTQHFDENGNPTVEQWYYEDELHLEK
ncbi:toxin-antitoxin system YwqK family antitoxin [bacterium SCSIO 12741]|nr:toxin-antitoxin system YwqK family antitoxin [bacterium SCSIO 12741]